MISLKVNLSASITPSVEEAFVNWLYANSVVRNEDNVERLVQLLALEQWDPELELKFCQFVAERAGFDEIALNPHLMTATVNDFVEWR